MQLIKEPLLLFGEGNYALTAIKEIDTTEAFMNLDEETRNCQNVETYQECQAKEHIKMGLERCNCTPYELRNHSNKANK